MRYLKNTAIACLLVLAIAACTTTSFYKSVATIETTVDKGMLAWGDYAKQQRAAGVDMTAKATQVKLGYMTYRGTMNTVYEVRTAATSTNMTVQINAATTAALNLLNIINQFLPAPKQVSTKSLKSL